MIDKIKNFFKNSDFNLVLMYGSYAKGNYSEKSDVDIAVYGNHQLSNNEIIELTNKLNHHLQKEVDLIDLRTTNYTLLEEILGAHIVIKSENNDLIVKLTSRMLTDKESLEKTLNQILDTKRKEFLGNE